MSLSFHAVTLPETNVLVLFVLMFSELIGKSRLSFVPPT